jgi:hypothetical protein
MRWCFITQISQKNHHTAAGSSKRQFPANERRFALQKVVWELQIAVLTKNKKAGKIKRKFV